MAENRTEHTPSPLGALGVKDSSACRNMLEKEIDILPYIKCLKVDREQWHAFLRGLYRSDQNITEYFTIAVRQEINNAVNDPRVLSRAP